MENLWPQHVGYLWLTHSENSEALQFITREPKLYFRERRNFHVVSEIFVTNSLNWVASISSGNVSIFSISGQKPL